MRFLAVFLCWIIEDSIVLVFKFNKKENYSRYQLN